MPGRLNFRISGLNDIASEFAMSKDQVRDMTKAVLAQVTAAVVRNWHNVAKRELHGTRTGYLRGIKVISQGELTNAIVLFGAFNNMLERGTSPFDMKKGFSRSPKRKISKEGKWYLHIPFRLATPEAIGESEAFAGKMPPEIHKVVKKLEITPTAGGGGVSRGLKAQEIPKKHAEPRARRKTGGWDEYQHKSSIYEGAFKSVVKGQSHYGTIRTVGEASDPNSFIHSGFKAYNFAEKALKNSNLQVVVDEAVDDYLIASGLA